MMQYVLRTQTMRRATTLVAAIASLGCTADNPVEPEFDTRGTARPQAATFDSAAGTLAASNNAVPVSDAPIPTPAVVVPAPLTRSTIGTSRYAREQSLGFRNETIEAPCMDEGESMGAWKLRYSGYGCVGLTSGENGTALTMQPMSATVGDETHAPLLLGPEYGDRLMMSARVETVQQLRKNGEPNAWEVAWLIWQYQDDEHFYYFIPKPNGWEVGKRDPAYPGGQRFLATGTDLKFPVGRTYNVQITHKGNVFSVVVDGVALASFTDTERPYVSGRIALYSEDAEIKVHQISVRTGAF